MTAHRQEQESWPSSSFRAWLRARVGAWVFAGIATLIPGALIAATTATPAANPATTEPATAYTDRIIIRLKATAAQAHQSTNTQSTPAQQTERRRDRKSVV